MHHCIISHIRDMLPWQKCLVLRPLNISFRRSLIGDKLNDWYNLVARLLNVDLPEGRDNFRWSLFANGSFFLRSMYKHLINNGIRVTKEIWCAKLPLRIKSLCGTRKRGSAYNG